MSDDSFPSIGGNFYRHLCMSNFKDVTITIREERRAHLALVHALSPWQKPTPSERPRAQLEMLQGGKGAHSSYRMHWEDPYEAAKARMLAMEFESRRGMVRVVNTDEKDNVVPFPR